MILHSSVAFVGPFIVPSCSISSQYIPAFIDIIIQRFLITVLVILILKVLSKQYRFPVSRFCCWSFDNFFQTIFSLKQFILRSGFLGFIASTAFFVFSNFWYKDVLSSNDYGGIAGSLFFFFLATFHFLEHLVTASTSPHEVTTEAFLLNHSPEYHLAMGFSIIEFFIELIFFPSSKSYTFFILFGTVLCFLSELVLKC